MREKWGVLIGNSLKTSEKGWFFERFLWEKWHDVPFFTLTTLTLSHLPSHLKHRYPIDCEKCEGVRVENKIRMREVWTASS